MVTFPLFKKQPKKASAKKTSARQAKTVISAPKQASAGVSNKNKSSAQLPEKLSYTSSKFNILIKPVLTEKSTNLKNLNQFVFEVDPKATKGSIKQAIQDLYKVKVESIRVINFPAKKRRWGRKYSTFRNRKKAVVTLKSGDKIEIGV